MKIEYDPQKSVANSLSRGLPFHVVKDFEWESALVAEDVRKPYPERRFQAAGYISGRVHVLVFTPIEGGIRVISLRKANPREVKRYEQAQARFD